MSYRIHTATARQVDVQHGTDTQIQEALGDYDDDGSEQVHLILNDTGNQEAFVLTGSREDFLALAQRITTTANTLRSTR